MIESILGSFRWGTVPLWATLPAPWVSLVAVLRCLNVDCSSVALMWQMLCQMVIACALICVENEC